MPRYVAFLRAVNAGGPRTIKMEVLRQIFEGFGFSAVSTFIASGNVIFETLARNPAALERRIEAGLIETLGYEATPFIRTGPQVVHIAALRAFPKNHVGRTDELAVILLTAPLNANVKRSLEALPPKSEEFRVNGREIYWLRHRGPGGEAYSTVLIDNIFDQPFTIRSVRTVQKIAEKYFA